ncbi:hypothetical protein ABZ465_22735 [Streptomyces griseoincarnatus]
MDSWRAGGDQRQPRGGGKHVYAQAGLGAQRRGPSLAGCSAAERTTTRKSGPGTT